MCVIVVLQLLLNNYFILFTILRFYFCLAMWPFQDFNEMYTVLYIASHVID